jgi:predicted transcriptional regulator
MKRKIGTVVDDDLYNDVKLLAAQERRRISDVMQIALNDYVQRSKRKNPLRSGLTRFLEAPDFNLTNEQFRESMELDFFEQ